MFFAYSCKNAAYNFVGCYGLSGNELTDLKLMRQAYWGYVPTRLICTTPQLLE